MNVIDKLCNIIKILLELVVITIYCVKRSIKATFKVKAVREIMMDFTQPVNLHFANKAIRIKIIKISLSLL